jgi:polyisoprenoid-binding protein YceI
VHAVTFMVVVAALGASPPAAVLLEAGPAEGRIVVHVKKKGLLSAFAHDHSFLATRFKARVELPGGDPAHARVEVVVEAGGLEDQAEGLSEGDRLEVNAQAHGPAVLDAARFPEVTWRAEGLVLEPAPDGPAGSLRGTARGRLTLRGQERPLELALEAAREGEGWKLEGRAGLLQSDFGVKPYSSLGGAVAVKDRIEVELSLLLRPAR